MAVRDAQADAGRPADVQGVCQTPALSKDPRTVACGEDAHHVLGFVTVGLSLLRNSLKGQYHHDELAVLL